jgi:hypothetical protein
MTLALYHIEAGFEAAKSTLSEGIDQRRLQFLHIVVYHAVREDRFNPVAAAREFAVYLDLCPDDIDRFFKRPGQAEAETICTIAAEFGLVHGHRQMPHAQAAAFAAAWSKEFDENTTFFSNTSATAAPGRFGGGYGLLFHLDHEAGVLAVSPTKAGIFWSAEDG